MGLLDFVKSAGRALGIASAEAATVPPPEVLAQEVAGHQIKVEGLDVQVAGDKVVLSGKAATVEEKEKAVLAVGNVAGVAQVDDRIETVDTADPSVFYTVKKGDTLSAIAQRHYGKASKYPVIFEANRPMLTHPDKIYPGQVLRIPPLQDAA